MLVRSVNGDLIMIKRSDFSCDISYHKKVYETMYPFIKQYPASFLLLEKKSSNHGKK